MKLIDLLSTIDENVTEVNIYDQTGLIVAKYDGKDSIDEEYNDCKVLYVEREYYDKIKYINITIKIDYNK